MKTGFNIFVNVCEIYLTDNEKPLDPVKTDPKICRKLIYSRSSTPLLSSPTTAASKEYASQDNWLLSNVITHIFLSNLRGCVFKFGSLKTIHAILSN